MKKWEELVKYNSSPDREPGLSVSVSMRNFPHFKRTLLKYAKIGRVSLEFSSEEDENLEKYVELPLGLKIRGTVQKGFRAIIKGEHKRGVTLLLGGKDYFQDAVEFFVFLLKFTDPTLPSNRRMECTGIIGNVYPKCTFEKFTILQTMPDHHEQGSSGGASCSDSDALNDNVKDAPNVAARRLKSYKKENQNLKEKVESLQMEMELLKKEQQMEMELLKKEHQMEMELFKKEQRDEHERMWQKFNMILQSLSGTSTTK